MHSFALYLVTPQRHPPPLWPDQPGPATPPSPLARSDPDPDLNRLQSTYSFKTTPKPHVPPCVTPSFQPFCPFSPIWVSIQKPVISQNSTLRPTPTFCPSPDPSFLPFGWSQPTNWIQLIFNESKSVVSRSLLTSLWPSSSSQSFIDRWSPTIGSGEGHRCGQDLVLRS